VWVNGLHVVMSAGLMRVN